MNVGLIVFGVVFLVLAYILLRESVAHRFAQRCWNYAGIMFALIPVTTLLVVAINVTVNPPKYSGVALLLFALLGALTLAIGLPLALISFIIAYIIKRRHATKAPNIT